MKFPSVTGSNLEGRKFNLPADFEGELNIALVPFQQWQQSWVDKWLPFVKSLTQTYPGLRAYELPTLAPFGAIQRWWIDQGMRMGIPDRKVREATITLYTDKPAFRAALGLGGEDTIYALLLKRDGTVLWRESGEFSPAKGQALQKAVTASVVL
jgi:hypothetical protein